jgi:hypothetical protein
MNETRFADDGWAESMTQLIYSRLGKFGQAELDETVLVDLARTQQVNPLDFGSRAYWIRVFNKARPGIFLERIFEPTVLQWPNDLLAENAAATRNLFEELNAGSRRGKISPFNLIGIEKAVASAGYTRISPSASSSEVAWLCCVVYEWKDSYPALADLTDNVFGKGFFSRCFIRRDAASLEEHEFLERHGRSADLLSEEELQASPLSKDRWFRQWIDGKRSLLKGPTSEEESKAALAASLSLD